MVYRICSWDVGTKNLSYYCGSHKTLYKPFIEDIIKFTKIEKGECSYCKKNGYYLKNDENKVYCLIHKNQIINKTSNLYKLKKIKIHNSSNMEPKNICETMYKKLEEIKELIDVDEVLIENQPGLTNPR